MTNVGPRHTRQARRGPIPELANFATNCIGPSCRVPAIRSGGVLVGNVPGRNCSHLEPFHRNNLYVQTCATIAAEYDDDVALDAFVVTESSSHLFVADLMVDVDAQDHGPPRVVVLQEMEEFELVSVGADPMGS